MKSLLAVIEKLFGGEDRNRGGYSKIPLYFKIFDWEKAEDEADKEIAAGKTKLFDTVEDLISDVRF